MAKAQKKNMGVPIGSTYKPIELISKNDPLLSFNTLTSKKFSEEYRKEYLKKVRNLFTIDELIVKWGLRKNKITLHKFFIANNVAIFDEDNKLAYELNFLISSKNVSNKEIRKRLINAIGKYTVPTLAFYYGLTDEAFIFYLDAFDVNEKENFTSTNLETFKSFSMLTEEEKSIITQKEGETVMNKNKTYEYTTTIDPESRLVIGVESKLVDTPPVMSFEEQNRRRKEQMMNMSIITFLNLPEKERTKKLTDLILLYSLKNHEIEKILGIPSEVYLRKLQARHMIFCFYKHEKLKEAFKKFKTFEECQVLVGDIISQNRYSEFGLNEKNFKVLADTYFDVTYSKQKGLVAEDWETFCKKIITQAINFYKKKTRITNLTEEEVLNFERDNRKIIPTKDLIAITREVIKSLYNDHHEWISIFDFKTEIERNGFELDSNERLIQVIDDLIEKKSFRSYFFTLKKMTMNNPVLSEDSSVRWEFVSTKQKAPEPVVVKENIPSTRKKKVETQETTETQIVEESKPKTEKVVKQTKVDTSFINNLNMDISFNEGNIESVINFLKARMEEIGSGNLSISISKS